MVVCKSLEFKLCRIANAKRLITSSAWGPSDPFSLRPAFRAIASYRVRKSRPRANGGHRSARTMSGIPTAIGISQYMK